MQTTFRIPDPQLGVIANICKERGISTEQLFQEAIDDYLIKNKDPFSAGFGLLKRSGIHVDGLEFQRQIRSEWERAPA